MTGEMEKLRTLLDKQGLPWRAWPEKSDTTVTPYDNPHTCIEAMDGTLQVTGLTAEQVVIALRLGVEQYDGGFACGMKAVLQQVDGLICGGASLGELQEWIDEQWEG